jgi:HAD superfamily hydrolase (TIGR01549 family)
MTSSPVVARAHGPQRRLRAALFDFGGTLDARGVTWKDRVLRLCQAEGLTIAPDAFDTLFYRIDDALEATANPALSFGDTVRQLVAGVTAELRVHDAAVADRIAARFAQDVVDAVRDNAPLITRLAPHYRLGIVSNFYGNLATVCDELGLSKWFSVIVDSKVVGYRKPDPRIFQAALDALEASADQTIFVGDSPSRDMAGARALGMAHVWLVGDRTPRPQPCCPGDPLIGSLAELQDILL